MKALKDEVPTTFLLISQSESPKVQLVAIPPCFITHHYGECFDSITAKSQVAIVYKINPLASFFGQPKQAQLSQPLSMGHILLNNITLTDICWTASRLTSFFKWWAQHWTQYSQYVSSAEYGASAWLLFHCHVSGRKGNLYRDTQRMETHQGMGDLFQGGEQMITVGCMDGIVPRDREKSCRAGRGVSSWETAISALQRELRH